jgi:hypothetical protein
VGQRSFDVRLDAAVVAAAITAQFRTWPERRSAGLAQATTLLPAGLRAAAEPYLAGRVPEPAQGGPVRFIHDICPDHLIVDPGTRRLTRLVDFTDAIAGDPVLDFAGLIGLGGYPFIREVVGAYDLPLWGGLLGQAHLADPHAHADLAHRGSG